MTCPECLGTGHERTYEPWADCPDCDGTGYLWADDDDRGDWIAEEDHFLYAIPTFQL